MARLFFIALVALFALASAQVTVDDFFTVTSSFQLTSPADSQDRSTTQGGNTILGTEREIYIDGNVAEGPDCTPDSSFPQSDVEAGFWSVAQGRVCAADFELRLDGAQGAASNGGSRNDLDLGVNLNSIGTAMLVEVSSDLDYTFTIEIASTEGISSVTQAVNGNAASAEEFRFEWAQFSGTANFDSVGSISLKFPGRSNRDAEVSSWLIESPDGSISGTVFGDCNCDGLQNNGDQGIQSQTVTLSGAATATTSTSASGAYSFSGLQSGTYTVSISGQSPCATGGGSSQTVVVAGDNRVANFNVEIGGSSLECPVDTDTECLQTSTVTTGNAEVVSSCSGSSTATVTFSDSAATVACTAQGGHFQTITRTFTASGLGSCSQQIRVFDRSQAPTLSIPNDFTTSDQSVCANNAPESTTGTATAASSCSAASVSSTDSTVNDCSAECNFATTIVRTWTATDDCGNVSPSQSQRITCEGDGDCPLCPVCPTGVSPVPNVPNVPVNPPTRNCRFICDDDDSSASILSMSVLALVALFAVLF